MDWTVILDGFVLLMALLGALFLLYGLGLAMSPLLGDSPKPRSAESRTRPRAARWA